MRSSPSSPNPTTKPPPPHRPSPRTFRGVPDRRRPFPSVRTAALRPNRALQADSARRARPKSRDFGGDPRSLELAHSIVARHEVISTNEGAMLREIAEYDRAEAWRGEGFLSMEAWLAGRCRISAGRARTLVSTARRTEDLPAMAGALTDGRLTLDVAAPLAAVATPANEATLSERASQWTPKQARRAAADLRGATKDDSIAAFGKRCVRFNDERHSLWAQLTPDAYALVKSALVSRARRHDHPSATRSRLHRVPEPLRRRTRRTLCPPRQQSGRDRRRPEGHFGEAGPPSWPGIDRRPPLRRGPGDHGGARRPRSPAPRRPVRRGGDRVGRSDLG